MAVNESEKISLSGIKRYIKNSLGLKKFKFNIYNENAFGYETNAGITDSKNNIPFKFDQGDVISAMIKGKDVIAMMPTGGGKSLCFEIPAIFAPGITVVVSPITALIDSQVAAFNKQYKEMPNSSVVPRAAYSGMFDLYGKALFEEIVNGTIAKNEIGKEVSYKVLFVSPERLMQSKFRNSFMESVRNGLRVSRIVYDEVHCFSQWGWSFRPSYLNTIRWIKEYELITGERLPRAGFTATATITDIRRAEEILELKHTKKFLAMGLNPKINISIKGLVKKETEDAVKSEIATQTALNECLSSYEGFNKCIIFCNKKKTVDALVSRINQWVESKNCDYSLKRKHKCIRYHASMDKAKRVLADKRFRMDNAEKDAADILAASIAYGLGINNKAVDLVINYGMAKSLEENIQMIGRAGRSTSSGNAVLIYKKYSPSDESSMLSSAAKILKWELNLDDSSPINGLNDKQKDLLILLKIYRFCQYKEIIEKCLNVDNDEDRKELLEALTYEYFMFDVSDPENAEKIKSSISEFVAEIKSCYESYISKLEKKYIENSENKEKQESINSKINSYKEIMARAEQAVIKTKEFYCTTEESRDSNKEIDNMYGAISKIVKAPQFLKINNTQIANIIRANKKDSENKEGVCLNKKYIISEHERFHYGVKRWYRDEDNHVKLDNSNIKDPTGLLYIPGNMINGSYTEILEYVEKHYEEWREKNTDTDIRYLYGVELVPDAIRYTARRSFENYKAYVVRFIFVLTDDGWKLMLFDRKWKEETYKRNIKLFDKMLLITDEDENMYGGKHLCNHIGADVNALNLKGTRKQFLEYTLDRTNSNKDTKLMLVRKLRHRNVSFTLRQIENNPINENERILSYWDMCVFDAVCSLTFEGKKKIYLQAVWRLLCGDSKAVLSGGYLDKSGAHGIKAKLESSIEKLRNLYIEIEDPHIKEGKLSGTFLPMEPNYTAGRNGNGKLFGYEIEEIPVLSRYAELLNGEIISIPSQKMDINTYSHKPKYLSEIQLADNSYDGIKIAWDIENYGKNVLINDETIESNSTSSAMIKKKYDSIERLSLTHYALHRSAISKKNKNEIMSRINADNLLGLLRDEICISNRNKEYVISYIARVLEHDLEGYLKNNEAKIVLYSNKS